MARSSLVTHAAMAPAELKRSEGGEPEAFTGYAAVFYRTDDPDTEYHITDTLSERVSPAAFARIEEQDVRGLVNHDPNWLLGRSPGQMQLSIDGKGLRYEIPYDPADPDHVRLAAKIARGDIAGSSFSFNLDKQSWEKVNGVSVRTLESVTVWDVGPVTFPAYGGTTAASRQAGDAVVEAEQAHAEWAAAEQEEADSEAAYYWAMQRMREVGP